MTNDNGFGTHILRVAIIGSGPSGFYAAERLEKETGLQVEIDMYDRLPVPYGLVRGGVAPDHAKIKSVTKVYDKIAADGRFAFYGNVTFGLDLTLDDLAQYYHAVIFAVGAQSDRRMNIPGEDLPGSHAATEFVGWYNAHPDYRDLSFDLSQERVAIIGNGNVAMDVARILAKTPPELESTDIADHALEALRGSCVREIYVLGRRGPAQAAFTNPEIKELGELEDAEIVVDPTEAALDDLSRAAVASENDRSTLRNIEILTEYSLRQPERKSRRIIMRFLVSPVELIGTERVEAIKLVRNVLVQADDGSLRARATDETETIPVGLVFRSIGYKGVALPGVPFDDRAGVIPNMQGRVIDPQTKAAVPGLYAVGWIKRGPSGVIGTNKQDAVETVERLLEDARTGQLLAPVQSERAAIEALLHTRGVNYDTYADWQALDALEQANGQALGRPRLKFSRVDEMLEAVKALRERAGN
ncbi:MAG: FAD-dependent oxidoreductase [Chloroflexota bacterium]|nr:FAD-dependent oxidoreductase [Chloroflexota bacterium]